MGKLAIFALKLHKNYRIFEFRFEICSSLEKALAREFRKNLEFTERKNVTNLVFLPNFSENCRIFEFSY